MADPLHEKEQLIRQWSTLIYRACLSGAINNGRPIEIKLPTGIAGPRAGVLLIAAGLNSDLLLRRLTAGQDSIAAQFVPWAFSGKIDISAGRDIRIEAGWDDLHTLRDIKITDLNLRPYPDDLMAIGQDEIGFTVRTGFRADRGHILICGTTGSGKTTLAHTMIAQASQKMSLILIDGKNGASLNDLQNLPNIVGPVAVSMSEARNALYYARLEMRRRLEQNDHSGPRLIVMIDELQTFVKDQAFTGMLKDIAQKGREVNVNLLLATQRPTTDTVGDPNVNANLNIRLVGSVVNASDSYLATGDYEVHAEKLLGSGDFKLIAGGTISRLQVAYIPQPMLQKMLTSVPCIETWPEYQAEGLDERDVIDKKPSGAFQAKEIAIGLSAAVENAGRRRLLQEIEAAGLGRWGSDRADRLMKHTREILEHLRERDCDLTCHSGGTA